MERNAPPDYYGILNVSQTASEQQIREAYKRAALKTHPDRVAVDSPQRASRTRQFQLVNDAYFTLSDPRRRREYDAQRRLFAQSDPPPPPPPQNGPSSAAQDPSGHEDEDAATQPQPESAYTWAWNFFFPKSAADADGHADQEHRRAHSQQFGDVFEEMMREQGLAADDGSNRPTKRFWAVVGGVSGGALGFIVANVPGMLAGAVAGNRLGAIRDARGKSVYAVYQDLPQSDKARLLSQLAIRVFSHAVGV